MKNTGADRPGFLSCVRSDNGLAFSSEQLKTPPDVAEMVSPSPDPRIMHLHEAGVFGAVFYQGYAWLTDPVKVPVGASFPSRATRTASAAPCWTVSVPS